MFDLFRNREKTKKYMMGGILLMVSASMLLYLVPNYNSGSGASDVIVAKVGSDEITETDARKQIQMRMKGQRIPAEIIPNYVPTMINDLITERAMEYQAKKLGIQVSDQDVADYLRANFGSLFQDGKFVGKDVYAGMLAQQGTTIEAFESDLKRQMLLQGLRKIALEGSIVSPAEIELEYRKKNESVQVQYVKLTPDKFKKEAEPSPADMQEYYKTNSGRYMKPEAKNLIVLVADGAKLEQSMNTSDSELQMIYNQNVASFRTPERVNERHILLMTQGKPAADDPKIKAKAEDLVKQLRAGADFAKMAKEYSEDPGSKDKGGEYDGVVRGQMAAEFDKASFELKPMVISDPVKTAYGYHIIQVLKHEDARLKPFEEAKDELAKTWKQQKIASMIQKVSDQAQAAFQKDPNNPDKVAADLGMQVIHADGVAPGQAIPEVGSSPDFDLAIANLKKGEISQAVSLAPNKVAVAQVVGTVPARPNSFDEVKSQIHDSIVNSKMGTLVQEKAKKLYDDAKANGGDLAKAAKAMGFEVKTSEAFKRGATVDGLGSANYVEAAFTTPVGGLLPPTPLSDGTVVVRVSQRVDADMTKLAEQRDTIRESIKGDRVRDRNTMFEAGLMDALTKQGVVKVHPEVITRIVSSFRGGS